MNFYEWFVFPLSTYIHMKPGLEYLAKAKAKILHTTMRHQPGFVAIFVSVLLLIAGEGWACVPKPQPLQLPLYQTILFEKPINSYSADKKSIIR